MCQNSKFNNSENGQALLMGIIFMLFTLLFSAYFLFVSETYFRFFSNGEKSYEDIVTKTMANANRLNEISINNKNIIAAISEAQIALLKGLEYGVYLGYYQPYWETYKTTENGLSKQTKTEIKYLFKSYELSSARGFFIAKSLAERNLKLKEELPIQIRNFFIQSTNEQVNCFGIESEKDFYNSPGIIHFPLLSSIPTYNFHMVRDEKNLCAIKHMQAMSSRVLKHVLPLLSSTSVNSILNYRKLDELFNAKNINYGIIFVPPEKIRNFISNLNFENQKIVNSSDAQFSIIAKYLSKMKFFHDISLNANNKLNKFIRIHQFKILHHNMYCTEKNLAECKVSDDAYLKMFFTPKWSVTGVLNENI